MKVFIFFIILSSQCVFAQEKLINCSGGSCQPNFIIQDIIDKTLFSTIDIGSNSDDIRITTGDETVMPRSFRISIENQQNVKNLTINTASKSSLYNSADSLVLVDYLNSLNITTDGYNGKNGKAASEVCADTFNLGVNGFGQTAKTDFDGRRLFDLTIPSNKCVDLDIKYLLDNNFTCDEGSQELDIANPYVIVNRLKGKNRCIGVSYNDVCLSRTVKVTCEFRVKFTDPPALAGTYSQVESEKQTRVVSVPELEFQTNANNQSYINNLCYNFTRLDGEEQSLDLIRNNEFYNDLRYWDNNGAAWYNQSIKFLGGINQTATPTATQSIPTEPGQSYRLSAVWQKDKTSQYVSTGRITVYNSPIKESVLKEEKIYEPGSMKGIFLTSDDLPYHFGYVKLLNNAINRSITIENKDDRIAKSCSAPFLAGANPSDFQLLNDSCGTSNLNPGDSCSITIKPIATTIGRKEAIIKRNCSDDYGNTTTQLNEKIAYHAYDDYFQINSGGFAINKYNGYYWKLSSGTWYRCKENLASNLNCFSNSPTIAVNQCADSGVFCPGYLPTVMDITETEIYTPTIDAYPQVLDSSLVNLTKFDSKNIDIIFVATSSQTLIELGTLSKFHLGLFDSLSVKKISPNAGPSIKPPASKTCPNGATDGCVLGSYSGSIGFWDLYGQPTAELLLSDSQGYSQTYYTVPTTSDWRIRYVEVGASCPQYFEKKKDANLSSFLGFDDVDNQCKNVYLPEDPTGKLFQWTFVGFDRLPEFGTELVQCIMGSCSVQSSIRDSEKNILTINPTSGSSGTQQGEGIIISYDIQNLTSMSSKNGVGGLIGNNDINANLTGNRVCAKIHDAITEGNSSDYAKDPLVEFKRYIWRPITVIESGNYGVNPANNGKSIKIFKKIDSSVRYLLKKELF